MFFFTETLNVSRPVMDCLDQIQRADGMASQGRMAFSALPALPGFVVVQASRVFRNVKAKSFSTAACCHVDIVTLMGLVTRVPTGMSVGNGEARALSPVGIAG